MRWFVFLAILVGCSVFGRANGSIVTYDDKIAFLNATGATAATTIPTDTPMAFPGGASFTSGDLSFSLVSGESTRFIIADTSTLLPGQELLVSGNETFNINIDTGPVFSFGFNFIEPVDGANAPFEESTFLVTLKNGASEVGSFSFSRPNDSAEFVGVEAGIGESFDRVEIHETSASPGDVGENEWFGQFYTGTNVIPEPSTLITQPTDLSPGDKYRLVFTTSTDTQAVSTDIDYYNLYVSNLAGTIPELVALDTTWKVIASTAAVDARDNTVTNPNLDIGVPIYRLDDTRVANNNADLWDGTLLASMSINESGSDGLMSIDAWTGTDTNGQADVLGPLGVTDAVYAFVAETDNDWIKVGLQDEFESGHFYTISGELTAVPEPATVSMFFLGAAWLVGFSRRRRRFGR